MARNGKAQTPRRVTVTDSATLLSDADAIWATRIFRNMDASVTVYVGDSNVTASNGIELKAGEILTEDVISSRIYGIVSTGTAVVGVWEIGGS